MGLPLRSTRPAVRGAGPGARSSGTPTRATTSPPDDGDQRDARAAHQAQAQQGRQGAAGKEGDGDGPAGCVGGDEPAQLGGVLAHLEVGRGRPDGHEAAAHRGQGVGAVGTGLLTMTRPTATMATAASVMAIWRPVNGPIRPLLDGTPPGRVKCWASGS